MDLAPEHHPCNRPTDQRRRDVVEERRQDEDHHQQQERAFPVVGQQSRQPRGDIARLEVLRQQREAEQQSEEIREQHPFTPKVGDQSFDAGTFGER